MTFIMNIKKVVPETQQLNIILAERVLKNYTPFAKMLRNEGCMGQKFLNSLLKGTQQLIIELDPTDIIKLDDCDSNIRKNSNQFLLDELHNIENFLEAQKNNRKPDNNELRNFLEAVRAIIKTNPRLEIEADAIARAIKNIHKCSHCKNIVKIKML